MSLSVNGIDFTSISKIRRLDYGIDLTVRYFCFFILLSYNQSTI